MLLLLQLERPGRVVTACSESVRLDVRKCDFSWQFVDRSQASRKKLAYNEALFSLVGRMETSSHFVPRPLVTKRPC
jgi:hypothetical protein